MPRYVLELFCEAHLGSLTYVWDQYIMFASTVFRYLSALTITAFKMIFLQ